MPLRAVWVLDLPDPGVLAKPRGLTIRRDVHAIFYEAARPLTPGLHHVQQADDAARGNAACGAPPRGGSWWHVTTIRPRANYLCPTCEAEYRRLRAEDAFRP